MPVRPRYSPFPPTRLSRTPAARFPARRRIAECLSILCLGGQLAACAAGGPPPADAVASAGPAVPAAAAVREPETESAGPALEEASLPPLPRIEVAEFLGFSRADLLSALGEPVFRRVDKGAEILRFQGDDCLLDVFLYGAGTDDGRIAHFEARTVDGGEADRRACLNATPRQRG